MQSRYAGVIGLLCIVMLWPLQSSAKDTIDLNSLIRETQQMSQSPDEMTMVWWLPEEFWLSSLSQDASVSPEMMEQFLATIRPYLMLAVLDGTIGAFGGVTYRAEDALRQSTRLRDASGETYTVLPADEIDADTTNLLAMMKPVLVNMLGALGQNMHFVLFRSSDGDRIADARKPGSFEVVVDDKVFGYRLPLGSVLPPRFDPKTGEQFPGNYRYSPFTGTKLTTREPN